MKKVILGTSALVAASALAAGSASAAEKIKLGVSGYLQSSFVIADYDQDNDASGNDYLPTDIRHEGEVFFTGSTTLDNGLKFGVNIQLEARATGDQVDETYMYVDGSFGRILFGSEDSAPYLMHYASPSPVPAWGLASPNANASGFTTPSTYANEIGDTDKISYFTPRFSGFQLGVSYTPDADEETGTGASPYAPIKAEGNADEAFSVGANYSGKFGDVSVKASLGYQLITREDTLGSVTADTVYTTTGGLDATNPTIITVDSDGNIVSVVDADATDFVATGGATTIATVASAEDTDEINVGLGIGVGGFSIGAAYKYTDNDSSSTAAGIDGRDRHDWNVGVTYGQGPWKIGLQYAGVDQEGETASADGDLHAFVVGGQYTLGPGITMFGGVQYWTAEDALASTSGDTPRGDDATVVFVGTALSF